MPTLNCKYKGQLRTELTHIQSGNILITDAPTDNHGKGESFSPSDTVSGVLASCMMTIMGIVADRENIEMTALSADVTKVMAANPRRISEIKIEFSWPHCPANDVQRDKLKRAALTCPVALSLHSDIFQNVSFDF